MKDRDIDVKEISPYFVRNKISFIKNELLSEIEIEKYFVGYAEKKVIDIYFNCFNADNVGYFDRM